MRNEDTEYFVERLLKFLQFCQLHFFCDAVQLQYIGTKSYGSYTMLADISLTLSSLKMVSHYKGRTTLLTHDDLFSRFCQLSSSSFPKCNDLVIFFSRPFPQCITSKATGSCGSRKVSFNQLVYSHHFSFIRKRISNATEEFSHSI